MAGANTYDELGRITQVSETGGVVKDYTYDIGGNRLSFDTNGISTATHTTR